MTFFASFLRNESGATAIEYGLIAACLSLTIIAGIGSVANGIEKLFGDPAGQVQNAIK